MNEMRRGGSSSSSSDIRSRRGDGKMIEGVGKELVRGVRSESRLWRSRIVD
jgi:hypothetical protein